MAFSKTCVALVALVLLGTLATTTPLVLDDSSAVMHTGTPDRVVIDSPPSSVSADEVIVFDAIIYDPVNNVLQGDVHWSASNGSISDDGMFYPWSAGLVEITAEHNGLVATHNVTVEAGVPTSIEITRLTMGVLEPTSLTADVLDGRGNRMPGPATMVWDIDGVYAGLGEPTWTAEDLGEVHARVRFNQLEARTAITVTAGAPHAFVFDEPLLVEPEPSKPSRLRSWTSTATKCRSLPWGPWLGLPKTGRSTPKASTWPPTPGDGSSRSPLETSRAAQPCR